jgi:hypothetical protein
MTYSTDLDLLHWEPNLFRDAAFASQTLLSGTGDLTGTTFALDAGSFAAAHVAANQVIVLSGGTSGSFPIVSVDSATELTLSVLYDALFPLSGDPAPSPVGTASDLAFVIRTFSPQASVVSEMLRQAAGIVLGTSDETSVTILNPAALRRPCSLGTLQMIYSALAAAAEEPKELLQRADVYARLYRRALESAVVEIDRDGDGVADERVTLGTLKLQRV